MLAKKLKDSRIELHLTQQEVADKIHISRQMVSNWETGKNYPDIPALIDLSELYGLSLDYTLKEDEGYISQVRNNYQLIDHVKRHRWIDKGLIISTILIFIPILFTPFVHTRWQAIGMLVAVFAFIMPLIYFSYRQYLSFFKNVPSDRQPLMVPKVYGMGVGINPRHPIGRLIWILIVVFIIVVMGFTIYQMATSTDVNFHYMMN